METLVTQAIVTPPKCLSSSDVFVAGAVVVIKLPQREFISS